MAKTRQAVKNNINKSKSVLNTSVVVLSILASSVVILLRKLMDWQQSEIKPDTPQILLYILALVIFSVFTTFILYLYIKWYHKDLLLKNSHISLFAVIIALNIIINTLASYYSSLLMPVLLATALIAVLFDLKLAIVTNVCISVSVYMINPENIDMFIITLISGTILCFFVSSVKQRSSMSMVGLIIGCISCFLYFAWGIINGILVNDLLFDSLIMFLNTFITIMVVIGILPLIESSTGILTPFKLMELANPNHPLMKRMLIEAPGTYHHSLMVGNLAEIAAEDTGVNAALARVGAYFHDIGKLKKPGYFIENISGENPHDKMDPKNSTAYITSHTFDGGDMAQKYKIPEAVRDIIISHHGTTLMVYFYHKAKTITGNELIKQEQFRYSGPKPSSKEAGIVMLSDCVEAAVRSMNEKNLEKIESAIKKIIKDKLDDGQLDFCPLTLKDLNTVSKSFIKVLSGYYHEREEYPGDTKEITEGEKI